MVPRKDLNIGETRGPGGLIQGNPSATLACQDHWDASLWHLGTVLRHFGETMCVWVEKRGMKTNLPFVCLQRFCCLPIYGITIWKRISRICNTGIMRKIPFVESKWEDNREKGRSLHGVIRGNADWAVGRLRKTVLHLLPCPISSNHFWLLDIFIRHYFCWGWMSSKVTIQWCFHHQVILQVRIP